MVKTLHESETRENIFFPVMTRYVQPTRIISPGNFLSLEYLNYPTLEFIKYLTFMCVCARARYIPNKIYKSNSFKIHFYSFKEKFWFVE